MKIKHLVISAVAFVTFAFAGIASASLVSQTVPTPGANGTVPIASSTATGGIQWVATSTLGISGGGGSGTVTTSSAVTTSTFPFWSTASALSGTSTLSVSGTTLTQANNLNVGGTLNVTSSVTLQATTTENGNMVINNYDSLLVNPDVSLGEGVGTDTAVFGARANLGIAVPFATAYQASTPAAFDVFPKGPTIANGFGSTIYGAAWEDICSSDLDNFATTTYECLHFGKSVNSGAGTGYANISTEAGGNGTVQNLELQANGGNVGVATSTPTQTLTVAGTLGVTATSSLATTTISSSLAVGTTTAAPSGVQLYAWNPVNQTSTVFVGATSTATSSYRTGCLEMTPSQASGTTVVYADFQVSSTIAWQLSTSTCL